MEEIVLSISRFGGGGVKEIEEVGFGGFVELPLLLVRSFWVVAVTLTLTVTVTLTHR